MPKSKCAWLLSAVLTMMLVGCGVSPEKQCDAQGAVFIKSGMTKGAEDAKRAHAVCVEQAVKLKAANPDEYKCRSTCTDHVTDEAGMMNCYDACHRQFKK